MKFFKTFNSKLNYAEVIQLDGAFAVSHINYGESPVFNGINGRDFAKNSRKNSLSSLEKIEDVIENIGSFNGTESNFKRDDKLLLWKSYWLEYINAFDKLINQLPDSVVTIFIGRQAIEIGLKYLLLKKTGQIKTTHNLGELSNLLFKEYNITESYMEWVNVFCEKFCQHIEDSNSEYFRFPEYSKNKYFAGNRLDIKWLCYNFALIILKMLHFAGLDTVN